jgi:hypothetical protein
VDVDARLHARDHPMLEPIRLTDAERVSDPFERGEVAGSSAESTTTSTASMVGLAASRGTDVDPTCSTASAASPRACLIVIASASKSRGQVGSYSTRSIGPGRGRISPMVTARSCAGVRGGLRAMSEFYASRAHATSVSQGRSSPRRLKSSASAKGHVACTPRIGGRERRELPALPLELDLRGHEGLVMAAGQLTAGKGAPSRVSTNRSDDEESSQEISPSEVALLDNQRTFPRRWLEVAQLSVAMAGNTSRNALE